MGTPMTLVPVASMKRTSVRTTGMGCGTSEPRGITRATRSLRLAGYYGYIYSYPWDDRPSAFAYTRRHRHRH